MNNKIQKLILGIYLSVSIGICGYFYLNPTTIYSGRFLDYEKKEQIIYTSYSNFENSVLISIVFGILLFTLTNFFKKK
jgi:hypothetical protein